MWKQLVINLTISVSVKEIMSNKFYFEPGYQPLHSNLVNIAIFRFEYGNIQIWICQYIDLNIAIFKFEYGIIQIWIWQYSDLNIWQYIFLNGWIPLTGPSGRFDGIWQQRCINDANCGNHQTFQFLRVDFFISDIRSPQHRIWLAMNGIRINKPWPFPKQQGEEGRKRWKKCEMGEGVITLFEE